MSRSFIAKGVTTRDPPEGIMNQKYLIGKIIMGLYPICVILVQYWTFICRTIMRPPEEGPIKIVVLAITLITANPSHY